MSVLRKIDDQSPNDQAFDDMPAQPADTPRRGRYPRDEAPNMSIGDEPLHPRQPGRGGLRSGRGRMGGRGGRGGMRQGGPGRGGSAAPQRSGPRSRGRYRDEGLGLSEAGGQGVLPDAASNEEEGGRWDAGIFIDWYEDQFHSEREARGYEEMLQNTMNLMQKRDEIYKAQESVEVKQDPEGEEAKSVEVALKGLDEDIKTAVEAAGRSKDKMYAPHESTGVEIGEYDRNTGPLPAGEGGLGHTMEDTLRYLSKREGHIFRDPRLLAKRLISGELVKFKSHTERRQVHSALQDVANDPHEGAKKEWRDVKFAPLDSETRRAVVRQTILGKDGSLGAQEGRLVEAGKVRGGQHVLDTARRLCGGHYRGEQTQMVLRAVESLLPDEKPGQQGQRQARTG